MAICQQQLQEMANYVVKSRLRFARNLVVTEHPRSRTLPLLVAAGRQAVKKPLFPLKFLYFPITTTQIKPFKKAVFLGCKFSLAENKL